jgi:hypothetical protein
MMQQPGFNPAMMVAPQIPQQPQLPVLPLPTLEDPTLDIGQALQAMSSEQRRNFVGNAIYGEIEQAFP